MEVVGALMDLVQHLLSLGMWSLAVAAFLGFVAYLRGN